MPKFLIEREVPGASKLTAEELTAIAVRSCGALRELGPDVQWDHSYVNGDKITCVYIARDEELVREHARRGKFPADRVAMISAIIDPGSEEGAMWKAAEVVAA
ncbi:MAG: DUF4242 domain-containing protein [Gemmatimonadales bacterium]